MKRKWFSWEDRLQTGCWKKKWKKILRELINELKQINKCFKEEKERYSFENAKKIKEKSDKELINFLLDEKKKNTKCVIKKLKKGRSK